MATRPKSQEVDAFILFNEREDGVERIVITLEEYGITTYFPSSDIPGEASEETNQALADARTILIFLGDQGWGGAHQLIAHQLLEQGRQIISVLIGNPPKEAFDVAGGLFRVFPYHDLREPSPEAFKRLANAIKDTSGEVLFPPTEQEPPAEPENDPPVQDEDILQQIPPPATGVFADLMAIVLDGDDSDRAQLLRRAESLPDGPRFAEYLRSEIMHRFTPSPAGTYIQQPPPRLPGDMPSVRSWAFSLLIKIDPEHPQTRALALRHLDDEFEHEVSVRFWILAWIYLRNASYRSDAVSLASNDTALEVRYLSQAVVETISADMIAQFHSDLTGGYSAAYPVLRVLRVVTLLEFVPDICAILARPQQDPNLILNALYVLSNKTFADAAVPRLREEPGLNRIMEMVVHAAVGNQKTEYNFAILLAAFDHPQWELMLRTQIDGTNNDTVQRLIDAVNEIKGIFKKEGPAETNEKAADDPGLFQPGYAPETIDVKKDLLGIKEDVQTLTAVMMAKDVKPPLAIGLYGDWGSGKSFFMESMEAAVKKVMRKGDPERFCTDVCQIRFNAWHYVDTNLWASLVSNILEQLAAHVSPKQTPAEQEKDLLSELNTAQAIVSEAEIEQTEVKKQLADQNDKLQRLQVERKQKEVKLGVRELAQIFKETPEIKTALDKSLKDLGVPAAVESVKDLSDAIHEANSVRSRAVALFLSFFRSWNILFMGLGVLLMLIVIPIYLPRVLAYWEASEAAAYITQLISRITVAIGTVVVVLRTGIGKLKTAMETVAEAKRRIDEKIVEKRQNPTAEEKVLQDEIAGLRAEEQQAETQLTAAVSRVVALEDQIRAIREGRSLAKFLAERTNSDDYRKHLGLISTIQKDFKSLAERLANPVKTDGNVKLNSVDRIILYIDDLDRCPSNKVMEVLQAVHLLLAYPLFIVVVGVDPRWLLHSLEETYSAFDGNEKGGKSNENGDKESRTEAMWRTTPQNYLEKIFQIPFNLRRMTSPGYKNLMSGLMGATATVETGTTEKAKPADSSGLGALPVDGTEKPQETPGEPAVTPEPVNAGAAQLPTQPEQSVLPTKPGAEGAGETPELTGQTPADPAARAADGPATVEEEDNEPLMIRADALTIKTWESAFAGELFELIPTPRSAKRFSNIYRILKARIGPGALKDFEGAENDPGTFRTPMLLLALLLGCPEICMELFPKLLEYKKSEGGMKASLDSICKNETEPRGKEVIKDLQRKLGSVPAYPDLSELYREWIPRVSRFSFDVGRRVQAMQTEGK